MTNPKGYTQYVPGQCDRIVWRGSVYMLPLPSTPSPDEPLQGASFPMSNERSHELAEWLRNNWAGHSMMMEIASMLEKDRGCPMANKYTFRSLGMLGQMYDPIGMEVNFPNDTEFYLASDIASSAL